jgi:hypothetical protein
MLGTEILGARFVAKPDTVVNKIRKALEKYPAVEVSGGPVEVSLDSLDTIWLLGYFGNPAMRAGMQLTPKGQKKPKALYALPGNSRPEYSLSEFAKAANVAQEGDVFEVFSVSEPDMNEGREEVEDDYPGAPTIEVKRALRAAGRMRVAGEIGPNGSWRITHAYPAAESATMRDVLGVLAMVKSDSTEWARDEREAAAVLELSKWSTNFPLRNPMQRQENAVSVSGRNIIVKPHRRPFLAMLLCRHRYPNGPWDFKTKQLEDERWVRIEDENEKRTRERMRQRALEQERAPG